MLIKILEHRIYHTEPSILIDGDILINAPKFNKKVEVNHVLLTHSHPENQKGFDSIISDNLRIYFSREHEWFFKFHSPEVYSNSNHTLLVSKKVLKIGNRKIRPITVQHEVQKTYGKFCLGFLIDDRVMICSPCGKISPNSMKFFNNLDLLIIDGGYKKDVLYRDHTSISKVLAEFKDSNIKQICFLGTHRGYNIRGLVKGTNIKVDTLFEGDIIRVK